MENNIKDTDLEYRWFVKKLHELTGIDLEGYKADQMKRLLAKTMSQAGALNYAVYLKILQDKPERIREFRDSITINVSYMFRDVDRWEVLKKKLGEYIEKHTGVHKHLKIWSAGCSIGAEAVTLAMIMEELKIATGHTGLPFDVFATDIDQTVLERARDGIYTDKEVSYVQPSLKEKYLCKCARPAREWAKRCTAEEFFKTRPAIGGKIEYSYRNIFDPMNSLIFDLIVCRNVIIYFTREMTDKLTRIFSDALTPGGLLFIGGTELIFKPESLGLESLGAGVYRKDG